MRNHLTLVYCGFPSNTPYLTPHPTDTLFCLQVIMVFKAEAWATPM